MTEWLEYERPRCLHEQRHDLLEEWVVTIPRLSTTEGRWEAGSVQKYETKEGKILWRSLDPKRNIFRTRHTSREKCAQELIAESPEVLKRIGWRKAQLLRLPLQNLSVEAQRARVT